ncbi:Anthranilate synthase [Pyrolobus fumarii 1A]|uniref:anthranilate synthase n=1 Tax=Pyrolobus fumarii (strain DSM 11204 / 1A) TaxID=694429 RepID=G0EF05_PYRF1|nr:anthranilate synthase component I family protein [Pyrolobus fumarii]AEM38902.1 Anthranilate synthase [Pyrolobus fumarii 1A]
MGLQLGVGEPLEEWSGCGKRPLARIPEPRRLVAWAEKRYDYVALLESGEGFPERARYTLVAMGANRVYETDDILDGFNVLWKALRGRGCDALPCRSMLFGVVSYEAVAGVEPWLAPKLRRHTWPVVRVFEPEVLVVYDRLTGRAYVCPGDADLGEAEIGGFVQARGPVYETPREEFEAWVREAKRLIEEGEFFQIVLSRVERYEYNGSPLALYERLAGGNPSPYMFYLRMGDHWIVGTSPELLVKMSLGRAETHPIAGTRPRGKTPEEDVALEEEMLRDEKERAEHMMLVDLARNDLGRIAVPGTVRVTALMDVEKYSHVQHLVSRVEALVKPKTLYSDVLAATFPAGTVSGAPKTRAMEYIAVLEDEPRGPYAGAVGVYAERAGETAIVIRSVWSYEDGIVEARAGAGIVYDSVPEREYMETVHKIMAVRRALGVA